MSKIAGILYGVAKSTTIIPVVGWGATRDSRFGSAFTNLAATANDIRRRQRSNRRPGALPGKTVVILLRQAISSNPDVVRRYNEEIEGLFQLGASFVVATGYTFEGPARLPGSLTAPDFPIIRGGGIEYNGTLAPEEWGADAHAIETVRCAWPDGDSVEDLGSCYGMYQ